jgi:hypothetical protein
VEKRRGMCKSDVDREWVMQWIETRVKGCMYAMWTGDECTCPKEPLPIFCPSFQWPGTILGDLSDGRLCHVEPQGEGHVSESHAGTLSTRHFLNLNLCVRHALYPMNVPFPIYII